MTEDDTFAKLKKVTFEELGATFGDIANKHCVLSNLDHEEYTLWKREREAAAKDAGWTVEEWQKENLRRWLLTQTVMPL